MKLVTPQQMHEMDRATIESVGIPGIVLMERAALAAVEVLLEYFDLERARIGICCGSGNNGGDGFSMARQLVHLGYDVVVVSLADPGSISGDARIALDSLLTLGIPVEDVSELEGSELRARLDALPACDIWCDALLGTGIDRDVEGAYAQVIDFLHGCQRVMAIDIPSGLCASTGRVLGTCVPADVTVTFGLAKIGQLLYPGRDLCGDLFVVDIGIPEQVEARIGHVATALTVDALRIPPLPSTLHKGAAGRVLLAGGAPGTAGAILMSALAARNSGAGLIIVGTHPDTLPHVAPAIHEAMAEALLSEEMAEAQKRRLVEEWADVVALGPGLGLDLRAREIFELSRGARRLVLDADGLNLLAESPRPMPNAILTPHPGEAARLLDTSIEDVLADPVASARELAHEFDSIVCLKSAATLIAAADGRLAVNTTGNPGMATGGMGDALTGILAATWCQVDDPFDAACIAVCIHGHAGDLGAQTHGMRGLSVSTLIESLPQAWLQLESR